MAFEELIARLMLSSLSKSFISSFLLMTLSSIVVGTAQFTNLQSITPSNKLVNKFCEFNGRCFLQSSSFANLSLIIFAKALASSSAKVSSLQIETELSLNNKIKFMLIHYINYHVLVTQILNSVLLKKLHLVLTSQVKHLLKTLTKVFLSSSERLEKSCVHSLSIFNMLIKYKSYYYINNILKNPYRIIFHYITLKYVKFNFMYGL